MNTHSLKDRLHPKMLSGRLPAVVLLGLWRRLLEDQAAVENTSTVHVQNINVSTAFPTVTALEPTVETLFLYNFKKILFLRQPHR